MKAICRQCKTFRLKRVNPCADPDTRQRAIHTAASLHCAQIALFLNALCDEMCGFYALGICVVRHALFMSGFKNCPSFHCVNKEQFVFSLSDGNLIQTQAVGLIDPLAQRQGVGPSLGRPGFDSPVKHMEVKEGGAS